MEFSGLVPVIRLTGVCVEVPEMGLAVGFPVTPSLPVAKSLWLTETTGVVGGETD